MSKKVEIILICLLGIFVGLGLSNIYDVSGNAKINYKYTRNDEIDIYVATDIHYLSNKINDNKDAFKKYYNSGDGKQLNYSDEITTAFFDEVYRAKPAVLILSGDLTNNGELQSHKDFAEKLKVIEENGTNIYVIPGNHDIENPHARGFKEDKQYKVDTISRNEFEDLYNDFGYNEAVSRDKNTLSYLVTPSEGLWFLMIDTSQYNNNKQLGYPKADGVVKDGTLKWIEESLELAKNNNAKVIPVMHHNLIDHNEVINEGYTLNNNEEVKSLFGKYNIELDLTGHIHIQDIGLTSINNKNIYEISTNSLAVYPNQYGTLKYIPSVGYNYKSKEVDIEQWALRSSSSNSELLQFEKYSEEFFTNLYRAQCIKSFENSKYTEEEIRELADVSAKLSIYYFKGKSKDIIDEVKISKGYELWKKESGFMKDYLFSILEDLNEENNELFIESR